MVKNIWAKIIAKNRYDEHEEPVKEIEDFLEITSQTESETSEVENTGVLPEDHPLLERFQKALREHLLRVESQLNNEIFDIEQQIKLKKKAHEDVGCKLYDMQQEVKKQNEILEESSKQLKEIHEKRIKGEENLIPLRAEYDDRLKYHKELKKAYNERMLELSRLQALEVNIKKWSDEIEDEIRAAKRTVNKDSQDQRLKAEEKRSMDLILFNLDAEIKKKEQELEEINEQTTEQLRINEVLQSSFSDACADLDALQHEHKRLTNAWNEVIISIQHRDKIYSQNKKLLEAEKEAVKLATLSIEGSKKNASKEMETNERLEAFKTRLIEDKKNLSRHVEKESTILKDLTSKQEQLNALIEQTDNDVTLAKEEGNHITVQLKRIQDTLDKEYRTKLKIEEDVLTLAQDQLTTDMATEYRMKILRENQSKRRQLELALSNTEKNLSVGLLNLEKFKGILGKLKDENDTLLKIYNQLNQQNEDYENEIKELQKSSNLKLKQIDNLNRKLERLLKETQGEEISPTEMKIKELEAQIRETIIETEKAQKFWLMLQGLSVNLSTKRSAQLNEIQMIRRQIMINNQKSLKVDNSIVELENQNREIQRNIKSFRTKIELLGKKCQEKKKTHNANEETCETLQADFMERLRVQEMEVLRIEQEIKEVFAEIELFKEQILEKNREALAWEAKYKLIEETLQWKKSEKHLESEMNQMKAEVHRMEVRYSQLKRIQEKLVTELEYCVLHREKIFDNAMIRQKMDGTQSKSRSNIQHKLIEMKNKIKLIQIEAISAEKKLKELNEAFEYLKLEITNRKTEYDEAKEQNKLIINELEQSMLLKYQNLDSIVRKQQRAKKYRALITMKPIPKLSRTESGLNMENQKQHEINNSLVQITQALIADFPAKTFLLTRILQTLKDD
ncbi:coiled-coil domain-containing protein 40 [Condylostylus longicornis]|uniref:coiled-coil domain-containing protein 40 n=1 Tax=Condylostylus longicornis TaxID=2530218 RepID=UPI00244DABB3|nr:coiled-coil domain-containing protein 40 [Condylostylus longicornis]